ncbi:MAG: hypothetical protein WBG19_09105, partial [Thermoplasmata archaeon]
KNLAAFQGVSPASRRQWRGCLFEEIQQASAKGQAVNALCQMTGVSRALRHAPELTHLCLPKMTQTVCS